MRITKSHLRKIIVEEVRRAYVLGELEGLDLNEGFLDDIKSKLFGKKTAEEPRRASPSASSPESLMKMLSQFNTAAQGGNILKIKTQAEAVAETLLNDRVARQILEKEGGAKWLKSTLDSLQTLISKINEKLRPDNVESMVSGSLKSLQKLGDILGARKLSPEEMAKVGKESEEFSRAMATSRKQSFGSVPVPSRR